jgi:TolB protein
MDMKGGNPTRLTSGKLESDPRVSPDDRWVVYSSITGDSTVESLWKVSVDGGSPQRLTEKYSVSPAISPDGKFVAYFERPAADTPTRLVVIPFEGGPPVKMYRIPAPDDLSRHPVLQWDPKGQLIMYTTTSAGMSTIWGQPVGGGEPTRITLSESAEIYRFNFSKDGRQVVLSQGREMRDVVLFNLSQ